jgi:hypothetical protein
MNENFKGLTKSLVESVRTVMTSKPVAVVEEETLDEGRGKKGMAKLAAKTNSDDDWDDTPKGRKLNKNRFTMQRRSKESKFDEATNTKTLNVESVGDEEFIILDEEFGFGNILESNDEYTEVMFEHGIETLDSNSIIVEEAEELDEISKQTLISYSNKNKEQVAGTVKKGKPSKTTVALRDKRRAGLEKAAAKLNTIRSKEFEAHEKERTKLNNNLDSHFEKEHPKILAKHGFEKVSTHPDRNVWLHKHDNGHATMVSVHKVDGKYNMGSRETKAANTKGHSWSSVYNHNGAWDKKDHDEHMKTMMPKFEGHIIDVKNKGASDSNW